MLLQIQEKKFIKIYEQSARLLLLWMRTLSCGQTVRKLSGAKTEDQNDAASGGRNSSKKEKQPKQWGMTSLSYEFSDSLGGKKTAIDGLKIYAPQSFYRITKEFKNTGG